MDRTHAATTIRQPAYAELLIDSLDRYRYGGTDQLVNSVPTTSSQWTTRINNYALNGYFTRLAITQIMFQWNLPTIITGYNDMIDVQINSGAQAGTYQVDLTAGYYTPDALATEIENQLIAQTSDAGWTVSYLGGSFVFANANGFNLLPPDFTSVADQELAGRIQKCYQTLGLSSVAFDALTTSYTTFASNTPSMLATRFIDICSSYLTRFQDVKDSSTTQSHNFQNKMARVYPIPPSNRLSIDPNAGPSEFPFIITIDFATPKNIMWNPDEALNNFDIQLRDEFGDLVPWSESAGCEYLMTLLASEN